MPRCPKCKCAHLSQGSDPKEFGCRDCGTVFNLRDKSVSNIKAFYENDLNVILALVLGFMLFPIISVFAILMQYITIGVPSPAIDTLFIGFVPTWLLCSFSPLIVDRLRRWRSPPRLASS